MANKITTLTSGSDNLYPRTKASAVSDDAGNSIENILIYHGNEATSGVTPLNADQLEGYNLNALIDLFYPVGSIYISTQSTSPATLFGRGTWVAIEGRFLIGVGSATDTRSDTRSFTNGQTGGEWTHVLSTEEMPSHTHQISLGGAGNNGY